jgi:hypothetical protein
MSLWYIRRKQCTYLASRLVLYQMNWIKHPLEFRHLGVLSGASKIISEPTVCLAQTVHLSLTDTNTISKWTKMRFHIDPCHLGVPPGVSNMISEPLVRSAQTAHLFCVKISTISNELNQASTWASSPRSTIGCVQNNFWAYGMFSTNRAPILNRHQHFSKWTKTWFHMTHVT